MLISIDHGNKQIKTNHRTFVSGLRESDTKPPFVLYPHRSAHPVYAGQDG